MRRMAKQTKNDTIYVPIQKNLTCKGNFCTSTHVSGLIATTESDYFCSVGEILKKNSSDIVVIA